MCCFVKKTCVPEQPITIAMVYSKAAYKLFNDPLMVRSSEGMTPAERAAGCNRVFVRCLPIWPKSHSSRVPVSPYNYLARLPMLSLGLLLWGDFGTQNWSARVLKAQCYLDFLTPSDVSYRDMEQGRVDLAVSRFNEISLALSSFGLARYL